MSKKVIYENVEKRLFHLLEGESKEIALMATIACELPHIFNAFDLVDEYYLMRIGNDLANRLGCSR